MKESAKILVGIMVIFFGFATIVGGNLSEDELVQVLSDEDGKFRLVYLKNSESAVEITIKDGLGNTLITDQSDENTRFVKNYNLGQYGSGDYSFVIDDEFGTEVHNIFYEEKTGMSLCKIGNQSKYKLSVENPQSIVLVSAFDQKGIEIATDQINSERSFTRVYDFSDRKDIHGVSFEVVDTRGLLKRATF